jgi:uncharacterized protein (UPF0333 family)
MCDIFIDFLPKKKANNNLKEVYVRQRQVKEKKKECNYIVVVNIKKKTKEKQISNGNTQTNE